MSRHVSARLSRTWGTQGTVTRLAHTVRHQAFFVDGVLLRSIRWTGACAKQGKPGTRAAHPQIWGMITLH